MWTWLLLDVFAETRCHAVDHIAQPHTHAGSLLKSNGALVEISRSLVANSLNGRSAASPNHHLKLHTSGNHQETIFLLISDTPDSPVILGHPQSRDGLEEAQDCGLEPILSISVSSKDPLTCSCSSTRTTWRRFHLSTRTYKRFSASHLSASAPAVRLHHRPDACLHENQAGCPVVPLWPSSQGPCSAPDTILHSEVFINAVSMDIEQVVRQAQGDSVAPSNCPENRLPAPSVPSPIWFPGFLLLLVFWSFSCYSFWLCLNLWLPDFWPFVSNNWLVCIWFLFRV